MNNEEMKRSLRELCRIESVAGIDVSDDAPYGAGCAQALDYALELCRRSEEDFAAAWADYRTLCAAGGSRDYPGLMQLAHLPVAYAAGSAKAAAAFVRNKLNLYKN